MSAWVPDRHLGLMHCLPSPGHEHEPRFNHSAFVRDLIGRAGVISPQEVGHTLGATFSGILFVQRPTLKGKDAAFHKQLTTMEFCIQLRPCIAFGTERQRSSVHRARTVRSDQCKKRKLVCGSSKLSNPHSRLISTQSSTCSPSHHPQRCRPSHCRSTGNPE